MMKHILFYLVFFVRSVSCMEPASTVLAQIHALPVSVSKDELGKNFVDVIHAPICGAEQKQQAAALLLAMKADPNYTYEGYPLLHRCFWENNTLGVVRLLIENKAHRSLLDREKKTAFDHAFNHPTTTDTTRIIRIRYAMGLFTNEHQDVITKSPPVPVCISEPQAAKVAFQIQLYRNSCLTDMVRSSHSFETKKKIIEYLVTQQGACVNQLYKGLTPLQHALRYVGEDADALVRLLLGMKADPSVGDAVNNSAFFYLLTSKNTTGENCIDRVKMLFDEAPVSINN